MRWFVLGVKQRGGVYAALVPSGVPTSPRYHSPWYLLCEPIKVAPICAVSCGDYVRMCLVAVLVFKAAWRCEVSVAAHCRVCDGNGVAVPTVPTLRYEVLLNG